MQFDVKSLEGTKVAGVPLPFLLAALAGSLAYYALKIRKQPVPADTTGASPDATATDAAGGDTVGTNQPTFTAIVPQGTVSSTSTDTNDAWVRRAVEWVVANHISDVGSASVALNKYVGSEQLTFDEGKIRDAAVGQFGLPPETVPYGETGGYTGPASKQGTPPCAHTVKGKSDNTYQELALLYFGYASSDSVRAIQSANTGLSQPFAVGQVVQIPKFGAPKFYRATSAHRTLYDIARVNGDTPGQVVTLNPNMQFPVKVGTRVRVR